MAWSGAASCKARASAIRGSGRRCRPAYRLPPSGPVTRMASPGLAPLRRTAPRAVALAEHGDADHQRTVPGIGIAADQVDAEIVRPALACRHRVPAPRWPAPARGKATATTAARGTPAIAAMSERFTPRAL